MKLRLLVLSLAAALVMPAAASAQHRRPAPAAQRDWTRVVVATPEGGYRMGNPNAPVKLVEYGSISCPHCAAFAAEGVPTVQGRLVRSGRLSWEYRPYLLFPTDPGIFLLLRCQGAAGFFPSIDRLYATQATWQAPLRSMTEAQRQELQGLTAQQRIVRLTQMTGVDRFFAQRGMSPARISACLSDQRRLDQLLNWSRVANAQLQVQGTPTFFLNGTKLDNVYDWAALQPHLPAP